MEDDATIQQRPRQRSPPPPYGYNIYSAAQTPAPSNGEVGTYYNHKSKSYSRRGGEGPLAELLCHPYLAAGDGGGAPWRSADVYSFISSLPLLRILYRRFILILISAVPTLPYRASILILNFCPSPPPPPEESDRLPDRRRGRRAHLLDTRGPVTSPQAGWIEI